MEFQAEFEVCRGTFRLRVTLETRGERVGILGESGAGKTLTLRTVAGLERPERGRIEVDGNALYDSARGVNLPARERRAGYVFQNYALFPHRTVEENIGFGLGDLPRAEREARVRALAERMQLGGLGGRYPRELSGGQQQRVALARALAAEPRILLLDEPLSALDFHLRGLVEKELLDTLAGYGGVTLYVSHSLEEVYRLCDVILVLAGGRVLAWGRKEEIFRRPPSREAARLTGCKNFSEARPAGNGMVEALDWGLVLRVAQPSAQAKHVAIRANHVEFADEPGGENVFPCTLVESTETPFRRTLYLRLPSGKGNGFHIQAEVLKDRWEQLRAHAEPWRVRLDPERLFVMAE